jgi:hypothetical protein
MTLEEYYNNKKKTIREADREIWHLSAYSISLVLDVPFVRLENDKPSGFLPYAIDKRFNLHGRTQWSKIKIGKLLSVFI